MTDDAGNEGGNEGAGEAAAEGTAPASPSLTRAAAAAKELADLQADLQAGETPEGSEDEPPEAKPEPPAKAKEAPAAKPATLGESWRQVRAKAKALDAREADLARRESGLSAKAGEFDGTAKELATLKASAALWARVKAGDVDALEEAGLDYEVLTQGVLDRTSGKAPQARLEREIKELRERVAADAAERASAQERAREAATYQEAVGRFEAVAKITPGLTGYSPSRREAMGNALAAEIHRGGGKVPPPEELALLVAARLREEYASLRAGFEPPAEEPPAPSGGKAAVPSTLSRQDAAQRGGVRRKLPTRDEEAAEIAAVLRGG